MTLLKLTLIISSGLRWSSIGGKLRAEAARYRARNEIVIRAFPSSYAAAELLLQLLQGRGQRGELAT